MRILIIEDNTQISQFLKEGLEQDGYAVDCLEDGEDGEKRIKMNHKDYDLVILDWGLPHKNGDEICKNIREAGITTPIIMLTGRGGEENMIVGLDAGADDYIVKPFSFKELSARIRALMRRPETVLTQELAAGPIVLNQTTRKVFCNGKELELTLKEYSLLEYLMRNPNQVLSRQQIMDHVWDFSFDSFSNIVDVHLKNLRKKFGGENAEEVLETVRGVGYRLKV